MYASVMGGGMFLFAVVGAWMLFVPHDANPGPTSVDTSVDGTADPSDPTGGATAEDEPSDDVSRDSDRSRTHAVETVRFALYGQVNLAALGWTLLALAVFVAGAIYGYNPSRGTLSRREGAPAG